MPDKDKAGDQPSSEQARDEAAMASAAADHPLPADDTVHTQEGAGRPSDTVPVSEVGAGAAGSARTLDDAEQAEAQKSEQAAEAAAALEAGGMSRREAARAAKDEGQAVAMDDEHAKHVLDKRFGRAIGDADTIAEAAGKSAVEMSHEADITSRDQEGGKSKRKK